MDDVSDDVWSTQPVAIINSTEPIERTMDDGSTRLQREHNYTLKVTIITDYANVTSTTDFSEREGGREGGRTSNIEYRGREGGREN